MEKVYGPYEQAGRYRVFIASGPGKDARRRPFQFASRQEAERFAAAARKEVGAKSVGVVLSDWFAYLKAEKGRRSSTITTYRYRLEGLFGPVMSSLLKQVTESKAEGLYRAYAANHAADTHQGALAEAKAFFDWCRRSKLIAANPFADVEPMGRKRKRKVQHRIDDAAKLYSYLLPRAMDDDGALGVLIALLLGFRASEVVGITRRDLDAGGTLLWAAGSHEGKTEGSTRPVELPQELIKPLAKRAELRSERLLPYLPPWVRAQTRKACLAAAVPVVCAQALRGTHATIGLEVGQTAKAIAGQLGNRVEVMRGNYALPGSGRSVAVRAVVSRLVMNQLQTLTGQPSPVDKGL